MKTIIQIARGIFIALSLFWLAFGVGCLVYLKTASPTLAYGIWFAATACIGVIASWRKSDE
jgi:hypothetical protein